MAQRDSHWRSAAWGIALGGYGAALARLAGQLLDDVQLQQSAAIAALGFAAGACLRLLPGAVFQAQSGRAQAWRATLAALALLAGTIAWLHWAPQFAPLSTTTLGMAALLAAPLCLVSLVSMDEAVASGAIGLSAWLAGAGAGAAAALMGADAIGLERVLGQGCLIAALIAMLSARSPIARRGDALWLASGVAFLTALACAVWAPSSFSAAAPAARRGELAEIGERLQRLGLHVRPRASAESADAFGRIETHSIDDAKRASGLGLLLRDSAVSAALTAPARADAAARPDALCMHTLLELPYASGRTRVLLAGLGGSLELQCALLHGAHEVVVAEPSRALLDVLRTQDTQWLGGAAHDPRVRVETRSARVLARRRVGAGFDLIVIAAATSSHDLPAGVLPVASPDALLETDRGLADLLDALDPDGVLFTIQTGEPAALRFASTALAALRLRGARHPETSIAVHESAGVYGIQVRRSPFSLDQVLELHASNRLPAVANGGAPAIAELWPWTSARPSLRYTPGAGFTNRFAVLFARASAPQPAPFVAQYAFDLSPATDARPLFHEMARPDRWETWVEAGPYSALFWLSLLCFAAASALAVLGWSAERARGDTMARSFGALWCLGTAQPLAFALLYHLLATYGLGAERAAVLSWLGMPLGGALGLAWSSRQQRRSHTQARKGWTLLPAIAAFALIALALVPTLNGVGRIHGAAALDIVIGLGASAVLGGALALPFADLSAAAAGSDPAQATRRALGVCLPACAGAVPLASTLVLFAGYDAVGACVGALLLLPALWLALRARA